MKKLFNDGWSFKKIPFEENFDYSKVGTREGFDLVVLPHDWLIYDSHNLYEDSIGIYRKDFEIAQIAGKHYEIYFEGVYMDSSVYVNGVHLGDWKHGYSSFFFSLDGVLKEGINELTVIARHQHPNSRWYSGAGIYRSVYLIEHDQDYFATDSFYITPIYKKNAYDLRIEADVALEHAGDVTVRAELFDEKKNPVASGEWGVHDVLDGRHVCFALGNLSVKERDAGEKDLWAKELDTGEKNLCIKEWSAEEPNLYSIAVSLALRGEQLDHYETRIGFREIAFDPDRGLFVNGRHVKLRGMCLHHDLGALGAAVNRAAIRRQLELLKEMGANAIRTAHNMPAVEFLELCDEMGFYVMDEAFDMWRKPKNPYDYARFFDEWQAKDLASMLHRDGNHPCIILWSIGNEISDTHVSEAGPEITRMLKEEVETIDYLGHAKATICSNYMPWEPARTCADEVKLAGYNYGEKYYDAHHEEHPDWCIYGSETASIVASRGVYHFPYSESLLADEDEQCSALGNSSTSWGAKSIEQCIRTEEEKNYSLGQFIWAGIDYIGEPTPYHTKNSYFGQIDTAGFPKDSYYIFKAAWTPLETECVLHLYPYWCFNEGQLIDVRVATNAPNVELFLNQKSLGISKDHMWRVPYTAGILEAVAYDESGNEIARTSRRSFGDPARLVIKEISVHEHAAGCRDLIFFEVSCVDEAGVPVDHANNRIHVTVTGAGSIAGLDNGDSTDFDDYKAGAKRLFSGKLLIMVAVHDEPGEITVEVASPGVKGAALTIPVTKQVSVPGLGEYRPERLAKKRRESFDSEHLPAGRACMSDIVSEESIEPCRIELIRNGEAAITAKLYPACCDREDYWSRLKFKAITDKGYESSLAQITAELNQAEIRPVSDGRYRIRCTYSNAEGRVKLISELEQEVTGLGSAFADPYRLVVGSSYSRGEGEITNGNEFGVATARDGRTVVCFEGLDFGNYGSDVIHLPVFELASARCPIEVWQGYPGEEGARLLDTFIYEKPTIWNTYQEEVYRLPFRLTGIATLSFVLNQKIHLKGFYFDRKQKAFEVLGPMEISGIYGDAFTRQSDVIRDIGNNVTIEFEDMDFGEEGAAKVTILGRTNNALQPIHLNVIGADGAESRQIVEFTGSDGEKEMSFSIKKISRNVTLQLIFMPGSHFDFQSIQFHQDT